jgi:hypothetical protein
MGRGSIPSRDADRDPPTHPFRFFNGRPHGPWEGLFTLMQADVLPPHVLGRSVTSPPRADSSPPRADVGWLHGPGGDCSPRCKWTSSRLMSIWGGRMGQGRIVRPDAGGHPPAPYQ